MIRLAAAASLAFLLLFPGPSRADIYRWTDESGTLHFTDDVSSIPPAQRDKATTVIKEAPPSTGPAAAPDSSPAPSRSLKSKSRKPALQGAPPPPASVERNAARERDAVAAEIDQLKAKIAAKEALIQRVDDRQNLALNPLRARVLDPADLDLYNKYKAELPDDRQRLQELESRLQYLK